MDQTYLPEDVFHSDTVLEWNFARNATFSDLTRVT